MADWQILTITAAAIIAIVVMILWFRINPVVSLVIGAIGLGLGTGLGPTETTEDSDDRFRRHHVQGRAVDRLGRLDGSISRNGRHPAARRQPAARLRPKAACPTPSG